MDNFAEIFDSTSAFLRSKDISPEITKGKKASVKAVEKFRTETGIVLPKSFSDFFTEFADGFEFRWEKDGIRLPRKYEWDSGWKEPDGFFAALVPVLFSVQPEPMVG